MEGLTINEAAETTGWSSRMLRYIEKAGLIELPRTPSGYRIFGPAELQRLRTLRELLGRFDCALSDVAFANRLRSDEELRAALDRWIEERPSRPEGVPSDDWLHWEQQKHERLLQQTEAGAAGQAGRFAEETEAGAAGQAGCFAEETEAGAAGQAGCFAETHPTRLTETAA